MLALVAVAAAAVPSARAQTEDAAPADGDRVIEMPEAEPAPPPRPPAQATIDQPWAHLQALNKITARVEDLGVPVGETGSFGTLRVAVRACRTTSPEETPENAAFLQIDDTPPGERTRRVFSGWMFASSPAVAAMEHPVYDVWVVACDDGPPPEPEDMGRDKRYALPGNPPPPNPSAPVAPGR
jgi:hypothetical protein